MTTQQDPVQDAVARAKEALDGVGQGGAAESLPRLRLAAEAVADAIDEAMATAVVHEGFTIRAVGDLAGLSENAVGPRLARTSQLGAYVPAEEPVLASLALTPETPAKPSRAPRITARAIERARYDVEQGRHVVADDEQSRPPMRFKPRRS